MNPNFSHPQFDLGMLDAQIDIISAWSTVDHSFDNYFSNPDVGDLKKAYVQWNQLKQAITDKGLGRVLSSYENTLQKNLISWVAKTREEHMPEVISTISTYGIVEPEMLFSLTEKCMDLLPIEADAVSNMLRNKTHLINTADRDANHEMLLLLECYFTEPQIKLAITILDDLLNNSNNPNLLMHACLSLPIEGHSARLGKEFKSWLIQNDHEIAERLANMPKCNVSDTVVQYLNKAGATKTSALLFDKINIINSFKKTLYLVNAFDKPLSEYSVTRAARSSPDELMMYFIVKPDYLCKLFELNTDLDDIDFSSTFLRAVSKLKSMKINYDYKSAGNAIDLFNPSKKSCDKIYSFLASTGKDREIIASHSNLLKRNKLEADFAL
jgi:hypothetical protein